jgi:hypothetical protein
MREQQAYGVHILTGGTVSPPTPDNDNWGVASSWETPAEALQKVRRMKAEMRRELAADFRLRSCPTHRRHWETVAAMEKCALWQYYGVQ